MTKKPLKLEDVARLVGGKVQGDAGKRIAGIQSLAKAGEGDIAFVARGKAVDVATVKAGALIVAEDAAIDFPNLVRVKEPHLAFALLLEFFFPRLPFSRGIDPTAVIGENCRIDPTASIGPYCSIGADVRIGRNSEIHAGVIIYPGVVIGDGCLVYSRVVIRENVEIGNRVIIQPGAVIGADGFGFGRGEDGTPVKIPQVGKVIIGDGCEIGANTCIDRSTIEETVLGSHVKMDNLVQIGHNVKIGEGTAISALTGISGSVVIGRRVIMGGQVGIADHVQIADGVMIAGKTGVVGSIERAMTVAGYPHQEIHKWRRSQALVKNLEEMREKIKLLEERIKALEGK